MGVFSNSPWDMSADTDYYQRNQLMYNQRLPGSGAPGTFLTPEGNLSESTSNVADDPIQAGYRSRLETILNAGMPTRQDNRFAAGLTNAEQRLTALLDDPEAIKQTAAYKFRLGQGQEALQRQLGAKGLLGSGNRLMELTKYGQDMASQEYDTQAKRMQDLLGTYAQSYLGGEQAATQRYGVEADAMGKRGTLLKDLIADQGKQRIGWADIWARQNQGGGGAIRTIGSMGPMQQSPLSTIL